MRGSDDEQGINKLWPSNRIKVSDRIHQKYLLSLHLNMTVSYTDGERDWERTESINENTYTS